MGDLKDRLQRIENLTAIHNLIAGYGIFADAQDGERLSSLWEEDGEYDIGGYAVAKGRKEIAALLTSETHRQLIADGCAHVLSPHHVELSGDTARASGYSTVYRNAGGTPSIWRVAHNEWHLRRQADGRWLVMRRINRPI